MSLFDRDRMGMAIYAAAFGAEHVRAMAANESFPHEKASAAGRAAKAAYERVIRDETAAAERAVPLSNGRCLVGGIGPMSEC